MLLERGIVVSCETIRRWGQEFGPDDARSFHRKSPRPDDIWHLDEAVISIAGKKHWLWRAGDQNGYGLDAIVQTRRNSKAARRLLNWLLRKQGMAPKRGITGKLGSYGRAKKQVMPKVDHCAQKELNIRAENSHVPYSHVPVRKRERIIQHFRSARALQRFVSIFSDVRNLFVPPRSKRSAPGIHLHRPYALAPWKSVSLGA